MKLALFIVLGILASSESAKILFYSAFGTYSHRIAVWPLVEALADRGHEVTYFSSSPPKSPNPKIKEFIPNSISKSNGEGILNFNILHARLAGNLLNTWEATPYLAAALCEQILSSEDTKKWVKQSEFDLVIIDPLFNDCALGFVHKFGAKHILYGTNSFVIWNYEPFGLVAESSWIPDLILHYPQDMSLWQRIRTTIEPIRWYFKLQWYYLPRVEQIIKKELGLHDLPPLWELQRNASLYFSNSHCSDEYARSVPPFVIPVGGLHLETRDKNQSDPFPENISTFIESSGDAGFVYISFGSEVRISTLPREILNVFFNALQNININVIWKWGDVAPEDAPKNIMFVQWAPQRKILASPKIKAFVTHGGLLGIHEAIESKVPMLVIPVFAEQDFNGERVARNGYGVCLDIQNLEEKKLTSVLRDVIENKSYKDKITEVSENFRDRQNNPLETAIWYTEFVLRHKDTSFLKPLSINQTWYQRRLLDVWAFIFGIVLVVILLASYLLIKVIMYLFCKSSARVDSKSKTQ